MGRVSSYTTRSGKRVSSYTRSGRFNRKSRVLKVGGIGTHASMPKHKRKRSGGGAATGGNKIGKAVGRFPSRRNVKFTTKRDFGVQRQFGPDRKKKKQSGANRPSAVVKRNLRNNKGRRT